MKKLVLHHVGGHRNNPSLDLSLAIESHRVRYDGRRTSPHHDHTRVVLEARGQICSEYYLDPCAKPD